MQVNNAHASSLRHDPEYENSAIYVQQVRKRRQRKAGIRVQPAVTGPEGARAAERAGAAAVTRTSGGGTAVTGTAAGSAARTGMVTERGGIRSASPGDKPPLRFVSACWHDCKGCVSLLLTICMKVKATVTMTYVSQSHERGH